MVSVAIQKDNNALIALGGNLPTRSGDSAELLRAALADLAAAGCALRAVSRFFATPAYPAGSGPDFVNAAAVISTDLAPRDLLELLHVIEARHGRERQQRWGARTLDLDLLAVGDLVLPDSATQDEWRALSPERQREVAPDRLILPHPRLQDRGFVLVPLLDVAPLWRHPRTGNSVEAMVRALPEDDKAAIRPI
ncbi:2-amino-4-hydroxy-6-hydroxymethyldihydropteridine diphosphokinase [Defluviimonas sp. WL0002]|uniref:2-amino-4-hydroxy-6-hydroxymethyldihydropteridine pyrophosphokinase n=1 Tax=Albidovulum marisflavi TaxID=2984159 RepID=A0ABT2ZEF6_9RHOB|nr:2-amino-4-hydroxy-6-hydroxymethyldihydropteridine diphosphokinase [Defluviimonas sp. WL0002]MCV2869433.1 2-amino-4-hydroxy-6-hydroxymethyldihydropteridine diphosphokinase [Defluviimonas sp. WL0002]